MLFLCDRFTVNVSAHITQSVKTVRDVLTSTMTDPGYQLKERRQENARVSVIALNVVGIPA